jgi:hypothetical protein
MKAESWIAIYAAIVGTSAFLLNLKAWFDSGVKLHLSLIADGMTIGAGPQFDEDDLNLLTVTNRGDAPTVITNMVLFDMRSLWQRWRIKPAKSYVIPTPQLKGYPLNLPSDLEPSKRWVGAIRKREVKFNLHDGHHYTGIYASHSNIPYLVRIPKTANKLPKGTKPLKTGTKPLKTGSDDLTGNAP